VKKGKWFRNKAPSWREAPQKIKKSGRPQRPTTPQDPAQAPGERSIT
jgi:hypothetical protein